MIAGDLRRRYKHLVWKVLARFPFLCGGALLAEVQGKRMYLDLQDRVVCETLYTRGIWEENVTSVLQKLIATGMIVVDVGANVGYYTLLAAEKVGATGRVFAFEPDPGCYGLLETNIRLNQFNNVIPVNKAVADRTGTTRLLLEPKNRGGHRIGESQGNGRSISVEVISLDEFFEGGESRVDLIKIDIQGAEMAALRGMRRVIERNENLTIVVEFWPAGMEAFGDPPENFVNALSDYGFRLQVIKPGGVLESMEVASLLCQREGELHLLCGRGGTSVEWVKKLCIDPPRRALRRHHRAQ